MTNYVLMPALSPTMTEGKLARWLVQEGDEVASGDVLAEIETDKATMEVEAVDEGIVGSLVIAGGTEGVLVNSLIAVIRDTDESDEDVQKAIAAHTSSGESREKPAATMPSSQEVKADAPPQKSVAPASIQEQAPPQKSDSKTGRRYISPLAKKLAAQYKLDIDTIEGSGPRGRIIKRDIERVQAKGADLAKAPSASTSAGIAESQVAARLDPSLPNSRLEPHSGMRKIIAERLSLSKQTIPHFYLSAEVEMDEVLAFRKLINAQGDGAYKISVNDIIVKCLAHALVHEPEANAMWTQEGVRYFDSVDVSVAVAIPGGLVTPVVRDAQKKGLIEISNLIRDLATRARNGKLMPEEYQGGTISISNLGMYGIDNFQAVINPPQSCILAVGQTKETPVFVGDKVEKRQVMTVTLSVDHRVVDGALAALLLAKLRGFLTAPATMLL